MDNVFERIHNGERRAVARLISWAERNDPRAFTVLKEHYHRTGHAQLIGITGPPGSGKSTLTYALTQFLRKQGLKIGVIAVDPSSPFTGGAILGDRIRMNPLATDPGVFIRSMGTRGHLGGVSKATSAAIHALDLYKCDVIFIETVGVGQSEVDVMKLCDTTVMVMVPGLGDDIQAIKAGVMEVGDLFVVNKADRDGVHQTAREINAMLDLSMMGWRPPVLKVIATTQEGIEHVWDEVQTHRQYLIRNHLFDAMRQDHARHELLALIQASLFDRLESGPYASQVDHLVVQMAQRSLDPYSALDSLFSTSSLVPSP
jgi:LAO/AO transport system kinase